MSVSDCPLTLTLGTAFFGPGGTKTPFTYDTPEKVASILNAWHDLGGRRLDTARVYGITDEYGPGGSERALGQAKAGNKFIVDTKLIDLPGHDGSFAGHNIRESLEGSLKDLGCAIEILYLHFPDRKTPFEYVLKELDALHKEGKFKQLGLSNYSAEETARMCELADSRGWIKPSAYQGNYSALARSSEKDLFPVLREHKVMFYAYSPLAMGMLAGGKKKESAESAETLEPGTRFHPESRKASAFRGNWFKPEIFDAVKQLNALSESSKIAPAELSLRWLVHHSALSKESGDGIVIGASSLAQLQQTTAWCLGGPLDPKQVEVFERMWKSVEAARVKGG